MCKSIETFVLTHRPTHTYTWKSGGGIGATDFEFETMATMRFFNVKLFKSVYELKLSSVKGKSVKPVGD